MASSAEIAAGTVAVADQYNDLYDDVLDVMTGHDHTGAADHGKLIQFVPVGAIILWSGAVASIPTNWQLADGTNGTPDLRGRFVLGSSAVYVSGSSGGSNTTDISHQHAIGSAALGNESAHTHAAGTLTTNTIGPHTHEITIILYTIPPLETVSGSVYVEGETTSSGGHTHALTGTSAAGSAHTHGLTGNVASGGSTTLDTAPPYYALAYIVRMS